MVKCTSDCTAVWRSVTSCDCHLAARDHLHKALHTIIANLKGNAEKKDLLNVAVNYYDYSGGYDGGALQRVNLRISRNRSSWVLKAS